MYEMSPAGKDSDRQALGHGAQRLERGEGRIHRAQERVERAQERVERARERVEHERDRIDGGEAAQPLIWLRQEPSARRSAHSRAEIAAAAVEIADAEGFEAVSMRRVAQRLGAGTMTLYHYVRNKDELITLMVDAVMGELLVPDDELAMGWREAITQIALRTRAAFARHRWTLDRLGDGGPGPNGLLHFEQSLLAVDGLEIEPYERFELIGQIDDYVYGYSLREAEELAEHQLGWPQEVLDFFQSELDSGQYPAIRDFLGSDVDAGIARVVDFLTRAGRFERGLDRLLDGFEASLDADKH
jgi:AcrR family transcriptional regulator